MPGSDVLSLRQIEAFKAVMESTSVTAAAEAMRISQPGVSRLLRDLEHAVGFPLFLRRKGRLVPTAEARLFHDEVQKYFRTMRRLTHTASDIRALARGQLRIGAFAALSIMVTPAVIRRFHAAHPQMHVSCTAGQSRQIADLVASRFADLGIIDPEARSGALRVERLWRFRCVCALPAGHPLAGREALGTGDLAGQNVIALEREFLSRFPAGAALHDALADSLRLQVQQSVTACALVAEGVGIAIVDPFTAGHFAASGVVVRPLEAEIPFETCVVSSPDAPLSNAAGEFLALLEDELERITRVHEHVVRC